MPGVTLGLASVMWSGVLLPGSVPVCTQVSSCCLETVSFEIGPAECFYVFFNMPILSGFVLEQVQGSELPAIHCWPWVWTTGVSPLVRSCLFMLWRQQGDSRLPLPCAPTVASIQDSPTASRALPPMSGSTASWVATPVSPRAFETMVQHANWPF